MADNADRTVSRGLSGTVLWVLACVALLGGSLRMYHLGAYSFSAPEATTVMVARMPVQEVFSNRLERGHFPAYYLLMHHWVRLFGDSESSLRLVPALAGMLSVILVFFIAAAVLEKGAMAVTLVFALSAVNIAWSQEAKMYGPAALVVLASVFFLLRYLETRRLRQLVFSFALAFCALALTPAGAFVLVFEALFLFSTGAGGKLRPVRLAAAAVCCVILAWCAGAWAPFRAKAVALAWDTFDWRRSLAGVFTVFGFIFPRNQMTVSNWFPHAPRLLFFAELFFGLVAVRGLVSCARGKARLVAFWLLVPVCGLAVYLTAARRFLENPGYILPVTVPFYIAAVAGIYSVRNRVVSRVLLGALFALCALGAAVFHSPQKNDRWREAVAYVAEHLGEDETVYIFPRKGADNVRCYWKAAGRLKTVLPSDWPPSEHLDPGGGGAWYICSRAREVESDLDAFAARQDAPFLLAEKKRFLYFIQVYHFRKR